MIPELGIVIQTESGPHVDIDIGDGDAVTYRIKGINTGEVATGIRRADQFRGGFWMPVNISPQPVLMTHDVIWLSGPSTAWFESDEIIPLGQWEKTEPEQEDTPDTIEGTPESEPTVTESEEESEEDIPQESGDSLSDLADMSDEIIAELREILDTVRTHGPMRVTDVVIAMGWPRNASSQGRMVTRLTTLQRQGLVIGEVSKEKGPGRKPIMWRAVE